MVEAARKHKRVVQVGTQSRSTEHVMAAMKALREGVIGEILVAKAWNSQRRGSIGRQQPTAAARASRFRPLAWACARTALPVEPAALDLALVVRLRSGRHRQ